MPTTFEDRERAFEAKFAHDEELRFRVTARRDKLFAAWLSAERRLSATEAHDLQEAILAVPDGAGHDNAVLTLATTRLARPPVGMDHAALKAALEGCAAQAAEQLAGSVF